MAPILFQIPLTIPFFGHAEIPIYGFGIMLVLAFIFAPWLAWWRARREGLDPRCHPGHGVLDLRLRADRCTRVLLHRVLGTGHP